MLVEHELTGGGAGGGDAKAVNDVVETAFEKLQKDFTGDTLHRGCFLEEVAELTLQHTVGVFGFLLFTKLGAVLGSFATAVLAMLAGGEVAAAQNLVFAKDGFPEFACDFGLGTCVSCHFR